MLPQVGRHIAVMSERILKATRAVLNEYGYISQRDEVVNRSAERWR